MSKAKVIEKDGIYCTIYFARESGVYEYMDIEFIFESISKFENFIYTFQKIIDLGQKTAIFPYHSILTIIGNSATITVRRKTIGLDVPLNFKHWYDLANKHLMPIICT